MEEKPLYINHRKRLRERYARAGIEGLAEYEILELLLTYSIPRKDVKPVAKELLKTFGSLRDVLDAELPKLEKVKGMGKSSAIHIKLVKDLCSKYLEQNMIASNVISNPEAVFNFARAKLCGMPYELFMTVFVNAKNEVIGYKIIQEGTIDNVAVHPRKIIKSALDNNASGIILIHNHPSGHPQPSEADKQITKEITKISSTMDLRLLDHLIVGKNGYFSFHDHGLL